MRKAAWLVAGAALSAAAFAASSSFAAQAAAPIGDRAKGQTSFERSGCWQCHGHQGQGGREGPRIASPVPMAWPAMLRLLRTTRRNMPPYTEKVVSDQELADIYAYLQSVPAAPDFRTIPLLNGMLTTSPPQR